MKVITYLFVIALCHQLVARQQTPDIDWQNPKDTLIINRAISLFDANNFSETLKELKKLPSKYYSQQPGIQRLNGLSHYYLKNYSEAINSFNLALRYAPEAIEIYYDRAFAWMNWGRYKEAASDFEVYTVHFPDSKDVIVNIAYCLANITNDANAIKFLEKYEDKDTLIYNALAFYYVDQENYAKAIEQWTKALKLNPKYAAGLEHLTVTYIDLYDFEKALELINRLIELKPKYGRAHYIRGVIFDEIGFSEKAEESYTVARKLGYEWDDF